MRLVRSAGVIVIAAGGLTRCTPASPSPPASARQFPHATDRLVRLMDKELADTTLETAKPDMNAVGCEFGRLHHAFGIGEGQARIRVVVDSFRLHDPVRMDRLNRLLGGHTFPVAGGCDPLDAAADSTDPLPHWPPHSNQ